MGDCGVPTITCILLLLLVAALYASVNSSEYGAIANYESQAVDNAIRSYDEMNVRIARSPRRGSLSNKNRRKKKKEEKEPDSRDTNKRNSGRKNKGPKFPKRKDETRHKEKRPQQGGKKDGLPAGVNKRMMRLSEKIHSASTPFAAKLFTTVAPKASSDIVISPFSVHTALSMTMLGAKGRTEKEMSTVLGYKKAKLRNKKPHQAYKGFLSSLASLHSEVKIFSANGIFVKPNIPLEDSFRQGVTQMYDATFSTFNFSHPSGPEAPINSWVMNVTRDRIQNLLPPGTIKPLTAMVLVNGVYFNASWTHPFASSKTKPEQFNTLSRGAKMVDMMKGDFSLRYANHNNAEVVELPYKGDRLAMYILLPNQISNLSQLQEDLGGINSFERFFENLNNTYMSIFLPKFKLETGSIEMTQPLRGMGMERAFGKQADFSGISSNVELYIDTVVHKAFIDVHETGTEAAASTGVVVAQRFSPPKPSKVVRVDRPFIFVIRDNEKKVVLFIGAYVGHSN